MGIHVQNYVPKFMNLNDADYVQALDELSATLSVNVPAQFQWMIKGSIKNAAKPFGTEPDRDLLFQKLIDADLTQSAMETADEVSRLLPTVLEDIAIHILPAVESKGGGCCYAPGQMLLCIRCDELAPVRLKRNIAHEYSHTVRMIQKPQATEHGFGEEVLYSMRDYLSFEGLAMVLSDRLYPHPDFPPVEVSEESEARFWETTDFDTIGMDAYTKYMSKRAYEIASRIVSRYLETNNITIIEAHSKSDAELYWDSGYPFIR